MSTVAVGPDQNDEGIFRYINDLDDLSKNATDHWHEELYYFNSTQETKEMPCFKHSHGH